ncbi:MAG TPA: hypothetical protein VII95_20000 [Terriglobales bacterium]|jgi:hypothetical protein
MATGWFNVTLSGANGAADQWAIQSEFSRLWLTNGSPRDAALFCALLGDLPDGDSLYFSPRASEIAGELIARYSGTECPIPSASELVLLVGDAAWRSILFSRKQ